MVGNGRIFNAVMYAMFVPVVGVKQGRMGEPRERGNVKSKMSPIEPRPESDISQSQRLNLPLELLEDLRKHFDAPTAQLQRIVSLTYTHITYDNFLNKDG